MKKIEFNKKLGLAALIIGLMLPSFMQAQESNFGNWLIYIGNKKINRKLIIVE